MLKFSEIAFIIYMSFLFIFGSLFNLAILLVYRNRAGSNASVFLLNSLALVDFLISTLVIPLTIFTTIKHFFINDAFYCGLSYFLRYFTSSFSCVLLALIAFERYKTISAKTMTKLRFLQKSLIYNTKKAIVVSIVVCFAVAVWCFIFFEASNEKKSCIVKESYKKYEKYYNQFCLLVLGLIMLIMIILYIKSYLIVRRTTTKIFIKNLDSYQAKKTRVLNFLVRLTSKSTDEHSINQNQSDLSNETTSRDQQVVNQVDNKNLTSDCILADLYPENGKKIKSKINQINESNRQVIKFNDIMKDSVNTMGSNFIKEKEENIKALNYVYRETIQVKNITPVFMISNEIELKTSQLTNENKNNNNDQPNLFKKRLSNLSVSNSFLRKDWQVAKMFCLVTVAFVLSWIPWVFTTIDILPEDKLFSNIYLINNVINPVIYSFLSKSFRNDFRTLAKSLNRNRLKIIKFCS
ncbi:unnamed protein product [Brachionus calyciflorus]|uniref:G-protein coupled receptors family 1 profile domain-containing protein n=1 Tax=Brachionus calyciflorus TaxID=104777 RepID=A0A814LVB3_9BILA|nr:unnamed protein product [Brachionus calyciflorus]